MPSSNIPEKPRKIKKLKRLDVQKKENVFKSIVNGLVPNKSDGSADIARKIVLIISIAVIIAASAAVLNRFVIRDAKLRTLQEDISNRKNYGDEKIIIPMSDDVKENSDVTTKNVEILSEYKDFYDRNHDFVGWIKIDPIVDFPVVKSTNNKFYLEHDFDKKPTKNGTIFADYENIFEPGRRSANTILYGHNLKTHYFFEPILNYYRKGLDFVKEHPSVEFDTLYDRFQYKIFAGFLTNTKEYQGQVFKYWEKTKFAGKDDFYDYVSECLDRSYFYTGVDLKYGDELITLSTCDFTMDEARFVIVARRVRNGENPAPDLSKFVDNSGTVVLGGKTFLKRKMCDAYNKIRGYAGWAGRNWSKDYVNRT
jgi:sortase B